jgi:CheY-like chemotaxis protein
MEATMNSTILLIDDNVELLNLLSTSLNKLGGYTTIRATDGLAGLEQAMVSLPDCIVIDIMMPQLDGYQLVRALRGDPLTSAIPLIILTALAQDKDRFIGYAAGADQYLVKPVAIHQLVTAIAKAISINEDERAQRLQILAEQIEGDDS